MSSSLTWKEKYEDLYQHSHLRQNIIKWLPLDKGKTFLHLSRHSLSIEDYLSTLGKTYRFDYNQNDEFINAFQENIDDIIIDGYLDLVPNKKEVIEKCLSLLNEGGHIYIATNNMLGLRYFSGSVLSMDHQPFDHITEQNDLYTKKQWDSLLTEMKLDYHFYYPFPNYSFCEYIFKNTPSISDVSRNSTDFLELKEVFFSEAKAYRNIIHSGYFEDFSNSFFIVIGQSPTIDYVKFANERKTQYQTMTLINHNQKEVIKKPLYDDGMKHMKAMEKYYNAFNEQNTSDQYHCCESRIKENSLYFEFIDGQSLEKKISQYASCQDIEKIKEKIEMIKDIYHVLGTCSFQMDDKFIEVFGDRDPALFENESCAPVSNIDLIFDNIIVNDRYNVIDYEWVINCTVPDSFVVYRTLLHSPAITLLDKAHLEELYLYYGLDEERRKLYYEMEVSFQNYVSDYKLEDILRDLGSLQIDYKQSNLIKKVDIMENNSKMSVSFIDCQFDFQHEINPDTTITVHTEKNTVIKINKITIDHQEVEFETNAVFISGDDYYFIEEPVITITNTTGHLIDMSLYFYYYNNDAVRYIVELLQVNQKITTHLNHLHKHPFVKVIDKIGD